MGQLINSTNNKAMLVTLEFSIGIDEYKIVRGHKPAIFEIYKNNKLIEEDSSSRGYQLMLETQIIKLSLKTFKQIVVIGKAGHTPFMQLTASDRRGVIEDILDILVFSDMAEIASKKVKDLKSTIASLEYDISLRKESISRQKTMVAMLSEESENKKKELEEKREALDIQRVPLASELITVEAQLLDVVFSNDKYEKVESAISSLKTKHVKANVVIQNEQENLEFFKADSCPTCKQQITYTHRDMMCTTSQTNIDKNAKDITETSSLLTTLSEKFTEMQNQMNTQRILTVKVNQLKSSITSIDNQKQLLVYNPVTGSLEEAKKELKNLVERVLESTEEKGTCQNDLQYYQVAVNMLKDSGIKSKIILTFIPLMNKLINEYLEKFDMFVNFELDEMFNETIKSRNRDLFTYESFSEGEKQKIDLAILFAWRKIAMTKQSISCNILCLDETMDSSMDPDAVDVFIDVLSAIEENVNTFVISHRQIAPELFDRHIVVKKVSDFSIMEEIA